MATDRGPKTETSAPLSIDEKFKRTQERPLTHVVLINQGDVTDETIDSAMAVTPAIGSVHPNFSSLWLKKKTPRQLSKQLVEVDLSYETLPPNEKPGDEQTNPVDWAPQWLGSSVEKAERIMWKDKDGKPLVMTNGELYSSPVKRVVNVLVTRYQSYCYRVLPENAPNGAMTVDDLLLKFNNSVNSENYRTKPKYTWMLTVSASPTVVNEVRLALLNWELRYNPIGWIEERLQFGSWYLEGGVRKIPMDMGAPACCFLGPNGENYGFDGSQSHYKQYRGVYEELNYATELPF